MILRRYVLILPLEVNTRRMQSIGSAAQTIEANAAEERPVMGRISPATKMLINNIVLLSLYWFCSHIMYFL